MEALTIEAIPLRVVAYGDRDVIVTWIGRGAGKIATFGKGVRNAKGRKFLGGIELFRRYRVAVRPKRGDGLWALVESEVIEDLGGLSESLERMGCGACALELVRALVKEGEPEDALMDMLWRMLRTLQALEAWPLMVLSLRWFEVQSLALLGHRPQLGRCARTGRALPRLGSIGFSGRAGGVVAWDGAEPEDAPRAVERGVIAGLSRLLESQDLSEVLSGALVKQSQDPEAEAQLKGFVAGAGAVTWTLLEPLLLEGAPKSYDFLATLLEGA